MARTVARGLAAVLGALLVAAAAAKPATPHFKWGQSKELIFLSVMVRDLDKESVEVSLPDGDFRFRARNLKGEEQALDLPLREDVEETLRFEVAQRPDKWGTATVVTLSKLHKHRWDLLVQEPKKFKGLMDKDWSREDQELEPEAEVPYAEDNDLLVVTAKNLNKTLAKYSPLVVNVRYPWCTQCKSQDESFAKAAKAAKKNKKLKKVGFGVLDAREERRFAKQLGARCDITCEYQVFTEVGEEPTTVKAQWSEAALLDVAKKYMGPAVVVAKSDDEVAALKEKNTTCIGGFASEASPKYRVFKKVASLMRGELVFAARFGAERSPELTPHKQNSSFTFDGSLEDNGTALFDWIRPRAVPLLQLYDWQLRETYEKVGLPMAKVWINDGDANPSFDKVVRHVVRRVAKKYIGKLAFVEVKKSLHSYELRDFGLNAPEVYPAFGIASNVSYNSIKYGFEDFWKDNDNAIARLSSFCESVLAGTWPEAHESGLPHTNWTEGAVKRLTWKTFGELERPARPLLLQFFGKYRPDHERKATEVENLATALEAFASDFTVATYDTSDNYVPPSSEFKRDKYSSDSEWYWVPAAPEGGGERPPAKKLLKPKKDAPIKNVIEFAAKSLGGGKSMDVEALMLKFEEAMKANPPPEPAPAPDFGDGGGFGGDGMGDLGGLGGLGGLGDLGGLGGFGDLGALGGGLGGEL